jgi:hypothetical protein
MAIPLFSPVIVPMAQSFGPILAQLTSSPTIRMGVRILLPFSDLNNACFHFSLCWHVSRHFCLLLTKTISRSY